MVSTNKKMKSLGQFVISNVYHNHYHFDSITQQPAQYRLAENQPMAGLSILNEYENGMGKSETELDSFNNARLFI